MKGFRRTKPQRIETVQIDPARLLSVQEAASRLNLSAQTIRAMCRLNRFPNAIQIGSSGWRIPEVDLASLPIRTRAAARTFVSTYEAPTKTTNPHLREHSRPHLKAARA